ncbi:hypothetical protein [Aquimarina aquimarini]|uniref:hypothetical protein n=1 Tax=Aquimarina aquimarini TaxID=1191734 RepID=UPI001F203A3E|nr:hypothetical protein [Aquimarina aquimarini]
MRQVIYFIIIIVLISCSSTNVQNDIIISQKKLNQPLKLIHNSKENDSSYVYLCFPKTISIKSSNNIESVIHNYHVGQHYKGIDLLHYKTYEYSDKLITKKDVNLSKGKKVTLNLYYGYLLKISNQKLDMLIKNKKETQVLQKFNVYDISIDNTIKKWVNKQISDSLKGKLHFSLHNKEKGFFYKSLDIELFDD